jgi:hypothetical protein
MRGNCYEAAAKLLTVHCGCPGVELVHGTVTGQGPIAGVRYGHAWVEVGDVVLDPSNGQFVVAGKLDYYAVGEITEPVARYAFREAALCMLETGHYGPWDERPSSGRQNALPCLINETFRGLPLFQLPPPSGPEKW